MAFGKIPPETYMFGYEIIINKNMITGYKQARKHKKKRINKKWEKIYGYKPVYDMEHAYISGNNMIMSPAFFQRLKREVKNE